MTRSTNRSSCASGSGNVPSSSTGFCVASTRNGSANERVSPSTVTWRSSMASRRADWLRGVARLISSARRTWVKTGPGRNSNSDVRWLKTLEPVMSDGSTSGVSWALRNSQPSTFASERASIVLPTPGTTSTSACLSRPRRQS